MTSKIVTTTEKGQITLPKPWRQQFDTDTFLLIQNSKQIVIKPLYIDDIESEEIIFDADRDNNGKGISPDQMLKMLKKIKNEQN